ncbi:hypothetical protein N658DRAFT_496661 [Parathielavia hyrcaniae]|uniref:Uncharacterized protein n=1 Tax=Parathielavia hyrcaniae TaxID=113614 RepID=A0AAN6T1V2_9PEZI|nr:hypothetical protein N658DRAFT_496661 [Parathielavia hyrcaniae]
MLRTAGKVPRDQKEPAHLRPPQVKSSWTPSSPHIPNASSSETSITTVTNSQQTPRYADRSAPPYCTTPTQHASRLCNAFIRVVGLTHQELPQPR